MRTDTKLRTRSITAARRRSILGHAFGEKTKFLEQTNAVSAGEVVQSAAPQISSDEVRDRQFSNGPSVSADCPICIAYLETGASSRPASLLTYVASGGVDRERSMGSCLQDRRTPEGAWRQVEAQ